MQRKASKLVLISAGAALAWFLDPVSGNDRRRQVADRLSGLAGGSTPTGDPTGGATPPAVAGVQPPSAAGPHDLAQAVEAASGGEKVLRSPDPAVDDADGNRSTLRATW
jgi:hypothetical protein